MLLHDFPSAHAAHRFPVRIENDSVACGVRERAAFLNPDAQVFFRLAAQRNEALLVPFANRRKPFVVEVDLRKRNPECFRNAKSAAVQKFDESRVSERVLAVRGTFENAVDFFAGEVRWQVMS